MRLELPSQLNIRDLWLKRLSNLLRSHSSYMDTPMSKVKSVRPQSLEPQRSTVTSSEFLEAEEGGTTKAGGIWRGFLGKVDLEALKDE